MGLIDNIKARYRERQDYNKRFSPEERREAERLSARRELDALRAERAMRQERRNTSDEIAQEKKALRELKYGGADRMIIGAARTTTKKVGSVLQAFHQEARARTKTYVQQQRSVGDSPFSPANLSRGLGGSTSHLGMGTKKRSNAPKKKSRGKTIIIRT